MKTDSLFLFLIAGALAISCNRSEPDPVTPAGPDLHESDAAEVRFPSTGPLSVCKWAASDKIRIGDKVFSLTAGEGTVSGTFGGDPIKDRYFTIAYPSTLSSLDKYVEYAVGSQKQVGNASVSHLCCPVYIEDVTSFSDVELSEAWAKSNGGTFRSGGVVAFDLALPSEAGAVESITLESAGVSFPLDNAGRKTTDRLALEFSNVTPGSSALKAFLAVPEARVETFSDLKVTVSGDIVYTLMIPAPIAMGGGILTEIKVPDASAWTAHAVVKGNGTETSPYILMTSGDVEQMKDLLVAGTTVWFELGADIDMADAINWDPLNNAGQFDLGIHFDGKGHTISNFSCKDKTYASFFGVLNGTCINVTFDKASVVMAEMASSVGVLAGFSGATNGLKATVDNVAVKNSTVTATYASGTIYPVGGLFGTAVNSTITNCSFDGTVDSKAYGGSDANNQDRCPAAGIAARLREGSSITNCTSSGSVTTERGRYVGGISGWVSPSEDIVIKGCTNTADVTGGLDRAGGIAGHFQQGTVENCVNKGRISSNMVGSVSGTGGIVGYSGPCRIVGCVNEGDVTGTKNAVGGIIGYAEMKATIERCSSTGNITTAGRFVGGIAGGLKVDGSVIRNCWSSGKVASTGDQEAAGILGSMMMNQTVSCCYSTAAVEAARVVAGIVARACNNAWTYSSSCGNVVEKCIAWNPSVTAKSKGDVNTLGGSGIVVGFTSFKNTLSECWRNPAMDYSPSDPAANAACDQPDCSPANPFVMGVTPGTAGQFGCPYHGKAAEAGATVSSIAAGLGWDTSIWNLNDNLPKLK